MDLLRLQIALKGREVKSLTFRKEEILIGRNPKADICLDNPSVSWEHAKIRRKSEVSWVLADCDSANGTFLNHRRVNKAFIRDDDIITVGKFTLVVGFKEDQRKPEGPFSTMVTEVTVEPVDQTYALTTGQIQQFLAGSELPVPPPAPAPVEREPTVQSTSERPMREAVMSILEHRWGPAGIAALIGFLLGVIVTTCVG